MQCISMKSNVYAMLTTSIDISKTQGEMYMPKATFQYFSCIYYKKNRTFSLINENMAASSFTTCTCAMQHYHKFIINCICFNRTFVLMHTQENIWIFHFRIYLRGVKHLSTCFRSKTKSKITRNSLQIRHKKYPVLIRLS